MEPHNGISVSIPISVPPDILSKASSEHVLIFPDDYAGGGIISAANGLPMVPGPQDVLGTMDLPPLTRMGINQVGGNGGGGGSGVQTTSVGVQVNLCRCSLTECNLPVGVSAVSEAEQGETVSGADALVQASLGPDEGSDCSSSSSSSQSTDKDSDAHLGTSVQGKDLLVLATQNLLLKHSFKDAKRKEKKKRKAKKSAGRKPKQQKVLTRRSTKSTLERRYLCEGCGIRFVHKATYDRHLQELRGKATENKCSFCSATFTFLCKLKQHIAAKHPDLASSPGRERPVICHICGIQLQTSISMNKHMRIHDGDKPFLCKYCPKAFRWHTGLEYHERIHTGERPFKCPNCPKAFTNPSDMARHQTVHTGKKPHLCHQCGKGFTQSGTLNAHIKSKHSRLANSVDAAPAANLCAIAAACSEPIANPADLKPHLYVCDLCGKSFPLEHLLTAHVKKLHQAPHQGMSLDGGLRCSTLEEMKLQLANCGALGPGPVFNMPSCVPTEREIAEVVVNMLAQ